MLVIRRETISFGIKKKREERNQEEQLTKMISQLEKEADGTGSQEISDEVERKKKELQELRDKKLQGSLVRARAVWREQAEKPSKYFLTLEKRRYESKRISSIKTPSGIKRNQSEILRAFEDFFQKKISRDRGTFFGR